MPANSTSSITQLLAKLQEDYPSLAFTASSRFSWHAETHTIFYRNNDNNSSRDAWAILHELGHALLDHTDYNSDIELLQIEVAAWGQAHTLATKYGVELDKNYVEDCLDSYRDWLHVRATCPTCYGRSLQDTRHTYHCHNCGGQWRVTRSRLCRPYRRAKA